MAGCQMPPPSGDASEALPEFIEASDAGCEWDASWGAIHSDHQERYRYCLAALGVRPAHFIAIWKSPSPKAEARDPIECADAALAKIHQYDACMKQRGLEFEPDKFFVPYAGEGVSRREVRAHTKACAEASEIEQGRFSDIYTECMLDRCWSHQTTSKDSRMTRRCSGPSTASLN